VDRHLGSVVDETLRSVGMEVTLQKFSIDTLAPFIPHFTPKLYMQLGPKNWASFYTRQSYTTKKDILY